MYLDHAATSPMRPEAREAMRPFESERFANPSGSHRFAREARTAIDDAREIVADVIGATPGEIVFTSGGTEGANTAVLGAVRRHGGIPLCSAIEHHAVLHCVEHVNGVVVPSTSTGHLDLDALTETLKSRDDVAVVSVMAVNNETGLVHDIESISRIVRTHAPKAIVHTDAVRGPPSSPISPKRSPACRLARVNLRSLRPFECT